MYYPPQDWKEYRRLRAYDLHQQGWRSIDIARALDFTPGAISQWLSATRDHGPEALRSRKAPGATPKLAPEQLQQLSHLLAKGPEHPGFRGNVWTCPRVVQLVKQQFGVTYSSAHMSRILKRLGWTRRSPSRAPPSVTKPPSVRGAASADRGQKAESEGRTIVFVDEAALYLLPGVIRTYAPRGDTPILHAPLTRDHLSLMGGITPDGRIFHRALPHSVKGEDAVSFLRHLVRHPGRVLVIWDGLPAHRSKVVKQYLQEEAQGRVWLERLPGYAPDLNPEEGIWKHLKLVELVNVCCRVTGELRVEHRRAWSGCGTSGTSSGVLRAGGPPVGSSPRFSTPVTPSRRQTSRVRPGSLRNRHAARAASAGCAAAPC